MDTAECTTDSPSDVDLPAESTSPENFDARHLTVSYWNPYSPSSRLKESGPRPSLRLRGRWLDRAGFPIGARVRVLVEPGRLVVELVESVPQLAEPRKRRGREIAPAAPLAGA